METKYSTISTVNGNFTIDAEHGTDLEAAFVFFFGRVQSLWGAIAEVQSAVVQIVDSNMIVVKEERISPIVSNRTLWAEENADCFRRLCS